MKNNIIADMAAVRRHMARGECEVVGVLKDIILCHCSDNTFSTYHVTAFDSGGGSFKAGAERMTADEGHADLIARGAALTTDSGWYLVTLTISIAQYEKQNTRVVQADDIEGAELAALRAESVYSQAGFDSEGSWCDDDAYYTVESSRQLTQLEATVARGIL